MSSKTKLFKYIPGVYPVPMIMMWRETNKEVFDDEYKTSFGNWSDNNECIWTLGAYLIFDETKAIAYRFSEIARLVWLLRSLGKELLIELNCKFESIINEHFSDEFIVQ